MTCFTYAQLLAIVGEVGRRVSDGEELDEALAHVGARYDINPRMLTQIVFGIFAVFEALSHRVSSSMRD